MYLAEGAAIIAGEWLNICCSLSPQARSRSSPAPTRFRSLLTGSPNLVKSNPSFSQLHSKNSQSVDNSLQIGDERCTPGLALMLPNGRAAHPSRIFDFTPS